MLCLFSELPLPVTDVVYPSHVVPPCEDAAVDYIQSSVERYHEREGE